MALSVVASLIPRRPLLLGGRGFGFGELSCIRSLATQQQPSQPQTPTPPPPPLTSSSSSSSIPPLLILSSDAGYSPCVYKVTKDENLGLFDLDLHQNDDLIHNRQIMPPPVPDRHIIGSCHGFLICASSSGEDMRAFNPLTGASLDLPPAPAHFDIKKSKVVLSPSLDKAVLFHLGTRKAEFTGLPSSSWIPLSKIPCTALTSCVFHKGHIFLMSSVAQFFIYNDNPSASSVPLEWSWSECLPKDLCNAFMVKYSICDFTLVQSPDGDDLYFLHHVSTYCHMTWSFKVAKLDERNSMWNEVTSIGDLAIFAGSTDTIALHASDFPFLEPNAIYYHRIVKGYSTRLGRPLPNMIDTGIYRLKEGTVHLFEVTRKHGKILDFPPPIWFKPAAASF